jgi:hypothetical protein
MLTRRLPLRLRPTPLRQLPLCRPLQSTSRLAVMLYMLPLKRTVFPAPHTLHTTAAPTRTAPALLHRFTTMPTPVRRHRILPLPTVDMLPPLLMKTNQPPAPLALPLVLRPIPCQHTLCIPPKHLATARTHHTLWVGQ